MAARWGHFAHEADLGLTAEADSREELFAAMAVALVAAVTDVSRVRPLARCRVQCTAEEDDLLLVDWLNALIYEMATRHMLFARFTVSFSGTTLNGEALGEATDPQRHAPAVELKGVTYTDLRCRREPDGRWHARCVVDV